MNYYPPLSPHRRLLKVCVDLDQSAAMGGCQGGYFTSKVVEDLTFADES